MLIDAGVERIHLCTPSNKAVDEIISRLSQRGFIGEYTSTDFSKFDLDENLLRVGSCEYNASPIVKKHSLDNRVNKIINPAIASIEKQLEKANEISKNQYHDDHVREFLQDVGIFPQSTSNLRLKEFKEFVHGLEVKYKKLGKIDFFMKKK